MHARLHATKTAKEKICAKTVLNLHAKSSEETTRVLQFGNHYIINHTQSAVQFSCCDWKILPSSNKRHNMYSSARTAAKVEGQEMPNLKWLWREHRNTVARRELETLASRNTKGDINECCTEFYNANVLYLLQISNSAWHFVARSYVTIWFVLNSGVIISEASL